MKCRIARIMLSHRLDKDRKVSGWAARHLAECPACSEYAGRLQRIEEQLVSDAASRRAPAAVPAKIAFPRARLSAAAALLILSVFVAHEGYQEVRERRQDAAAKTLANVVPDAILDENLLVFVPNDPYAEEWEALCSGSDALFATLMEGTGLDAAYALAAAQ